MVQHASKSERFEIQMQDKMQLVGRQIPFGFET